MGLANAQQAAFGLTLWLVVIVLTVVTASVFLVYVRRRIRESFTGDMSGFTLEDLRSLKRRGDLTDEEYQALRRSVLGASGLSKSEDDG